MNFISRNTYQLHPMKYLFALVLLVGLFFPSSTLFAQLCPGGGTTFTTSVTFSNSWISGCATGISCTGGTTFDNRSTCEPTTSMDACAPAPSCTVNSQDGSDIWFNFYATGPIAIINVIPGVSFVSAIQAFSGGPGCGTLTEIGCVKASGPSSTATLNLSGLTMGQQYYFRVFGSAGPASQRTGTWCYCGTVGSSGAVLPVLLSSFKATAQKSKAELEWTTASELNSAGFEIERSVNATQYDIIGSVPAKGTSTQESYYRFSDLRPFPGINYYRLKITDRDARFSYSAIVSAKIEFPFSLNIYPIPTSGNLHIESARNDRISIFNLAGLLLKTVTLKKGRNEIDISKLPGGIYLIRQSTNSEIIKFQVLR